MLPRAADLGIRSRLRRRNPAVTVQGALTVRTYHGNELRFLYHGVLFTRHATRCSILRVMRTLLAFVVILTNPMAAAACPPLLDFKLPTLTEDAASLCRYQ